MKNERESNSTAPPKKAMRFTPKIPPQKLQKPQVVKTESSSETRDDVIDKELLVKLNSARSQDGLGRRAFKNEKKIAPAQVAFGYGDTSKARTFGNPKSNAMGKELQEGLDVPAPIKEKEYVEPWDYSRSYYPVTLPLRRPHSGDPEILDEEEFGEASASSALHDTCTNAAAELGLMEEAEGPQMLFFQLPANLPLWKRPAAAEDSKVAGDAAGKTGNALKKGCKLEELPAGFMGKLLVYKSGSVKMKLGDVLFDVSPGVKCVFAQDVAAVNAREKHCCVLGALDKRSVVTPDVDSLLDSIDSLDVRQL